MALRIPKNIIVTAKYTSGKEFILKSSYTEYKGYYYEMNDKIFAGKEFNIDAPELIKTSSSDLNILFQNPLTFLFGKLSKINLTSTSLQSYTFIPTQEDIARGYAIRYFVKKTNQTPILIKEVNLDDFNKLKTNSLYIVVSVKYNMINKTTGKFDSTELNNAVLQIPELSSFLSNEIDSGRIPGTKEDQPIIVSFD